MKNYIGSITSIVGVLVLLLALYGLSFSTDQIIQTINDGATFFGDLAIIYGVIHQFLKTKGIVKSARLSGVHL